MMDLPIHLEILMKTDPPPRTGISTGQFAAGTIVELYQSIIAQEQGALGGDVEAIHDMRVAIRRLRVALSNFASTLPREDRRRLKSRLKHLAEPLGEVRDFDVMIAALESGLTDNPGQDAIKSVIGRMRERRRRRLRKLVDYLRGEEFADLKREFSSSSVAVSGLPHSDVNELSKHGQAA
jgi:CHAD domain-containing protein